MRISDWSSDVCSSDLDLPDDFYAIYVVDPAHRPVGELVLSHLLRTKRPVRVSDMMRKDFRRIPIAMDQEEVALLFRRYGLVAAPVVAEDERLLGVITVDDVVDVIDEAAEEEIGRAHVCTQVTNANLVC